MLSRALKDHRGRPSRCPQEALSRASLRKPSRALWSSSEGHAHQEASRRQPYTKATSSSRQQELLVPMWRASVSYCPFSITKRQEPPPPTPGAACPPQLAMLLPLVDGLCHEFVLLIVLLGITYYVSLIKTPMVRFY